MQAIKAYTQIYKDFDGQKVLQKIEAAARTCYKSEGKIQEGSAAKLVDYLSGLIVAGVFHKSNKTDTGSLESKTCWKGLCRKCMTLIFVLIAYRLDLVIGTNYIRDAVIIAFIGNELISLVENAGLMGVPLPAVITKAIDILQKKAEKDGE